MGNWVLLAVVFRAVLWSRPISASEAQDQLIKDLFQGYNKLTRPAEGNQTVEVNFGMTLNILVYVSDQDQVMKTNGYLEMTWTDPRLSWDPDQYGGISILRMPVDKVWQPDIALINTVDGHFLPSYKSNALIYSPGTVYWLPPFIFKSACDINPHYFPFDVQMCTMIFRSTTYSADELNIELKSPNMELKDYCEQPSGTWDVASVPLAKMYRMEYRKSGETPVVFVQLDLKVTRKSQFYVVTFLLPCVCIAFLTIYVFYLPTIAGEKICLAISILFSIVVFLLILTDVLPPSEQLSLMTKFLVFTFVCNFFSAIITVLTINIHYRTPEMYDMPRWMSVLFISFLPRLLRMHRPRKPKPKKEKELMTTISPVYSPTTPLRSPKKAKWGSRASLSSRKLVSQSSSERMIEMDDKSSPIMALRFPINHNRFYLNHRQPHSKDWESNALLKEMEELGELFAEYPGYRVALNNVTFIAKNIEETDEESEVADDWKYIALVIDRLLLWIFFVGNAFGSVSILLNSEHLFEPLDDHCPNRTIS